MTTKDSHMDMLNKVGIYGPRCVKTCLRRLANNTGADQPAHRSSLIRAFACPLNTPLTEHHLEFLSLKGGCTGSSESTLV